MSEDLRDNLPVRSVTELSGDVKRSIETGFARVRVRGEISRPSFPGSGHCYMTLKDEQSTLDAVVWRGQLGRLSIRPEEGIEVVATGRLTTFGQRSKYQMIVERMEIAGQGALLKLLEDRRRKLDAEGLFAAERKREIPFLPDVIGVVTSTTGAVIRDILHRLSDRFPRHVLVWPVRVQGDGAAEEIARAIAGFDGVAPGGPVPRPDLVIVARGGGSLEDLWAFNEEIVVRAAAACTIPLISAVGHETDTTLIDFAADERAPTPTAAAERAVPVRADLAGAVDEAGVRLRAAMRRTLRDRRLTVEGLARGLADPGRMLEAKAQRLDDATARLRHQAQRLTLDRRRLLETRAAKLPGPQALVRSVARSRNDLDGLAARAGRAVAEATARRRTRVETAARLLETLSYKSVLARGFVLVRDADGTPVTRAADAAPDARLDLEFHEDRTVAVRVIGAPADEAAAAQSSAKRAAKPKKPAEASPKQTELF